MEGRVVEFDERRGVGVVEAVDGARYAFHCTQLANGSRSIAVGADVEFNIAPGLPGHWEAAAIAALG